MLRFVLIMCVALTLAACQREEGHAPDTSPTAPDASWGQPPEPITPPARHDAPAQPPAPVIGTPDGSRLPLRRILDIVERVSPGEVIEVELDEDDGVEVYEVKTLSPEGRAIETTVHARTGQVLEREED